MNIWGFWYLSGILEPIPCRYQGTTIHHNMNKVKVRIIILQWPHALMLLALWWTVDIFLVYWGEWIKNIFGSLLRLLSVIDSIHPKQIENMKFHFQDSSCSCPQPVCYHQLIQVNHKTTTVDLQLSMCCISNNLLFIPIT